MSSFLDLAGGDAPPKSFLDLAGPTPKGSKAANPPAGAGVLSPSEQAASDAVERSPQTAADLQRAIATATPAQRAILTDPRQNGTALVPPAPSIAGAGRGVMPASAYQPPQQGPTDANGIPVAPGANTAPTPAPDVPWWQKGYAGFQAGANAITGATAGAVGGLVAGGNTAVQQILHGVTGTPLPANLAGPNAVQDAAGRGAAALTYQPSTQTGRDYAEAIGKNKLVQSLPAIAAVAPTLPMGSVRPALDYGLNKAGAVADRSMEGMRAAFEAKKAAAPRVEPSMGEAAPAAPAQPQAPVTISSRAPGVAPTLADASPELQKAVAAVGDKANPNIVARHVEADTLPVPGKLTAGQAAQDPSLISQEMNGRGKQKPSVGPEFYQEQGKTLAANMEAIRASAAPDIPTSASVVDHGQTLLDAYKTKDAAVTADITAKYKALADANGGSLPVNGVDFVTSADAALAKQMKGRYVPKEIAADLEGFRNGGPMTFEDFENLRTNLAAEGRKAERAGDGNAASAINIVRNSLESLPITGETAAVKPLADAARSAAKARFDAIRADPAYKAAVNDAAELGQPSPLADRFFNSNVLNAARENVSRLRANLADNPQATQAIAAGTLDHLKGQLKADPVGGNFSQANYNKALGSLDPKLGSLVDPTTAQQLKAVGGFAKNAQTQPRGSYVNNSNTAVELASQGTKAAVEHGTNMLFGGVPVGTVARKVGGYVSDVVGQRKAATESLKPGAGLTRLSDVGKK